MAVSSHTPPRATVTAGRPGPPDQGGAHDQPPEPGRPVFQPARRVATVIRDSEYRTAGWRAARRLIEWAGENADYYQRMGMEYAGQLFSRVMGYQSADGAYVTRPEAARLLAELALDQMGVESFASPKSG